MAPVVSNWSCPPMPQVGFGSPLASTSSRLASSWTNISWCDAAARESQTQLDGHRLASSATSMTTSRVTVRRRQVQLDGLVAAGEVEHEWRRAGAEQRLHVCRAPTLRCSVRCSWAVWCAFPTKPCGRGRSTSRHPRANRAWGRTAVAWCSPDTGGPPIVQPGSTAAVAIDVTVPPTRAGLPACRASASRCPRAWIDARYRLGCHSRRRSRTHRW